jgi:hypothetical protein
MLGGYLKTKNRPLMIIRMVLKIHDHDFPKNQITSFDI